MKMRNKPSQILLTSEGMRFPGAASVPMPQYGTEQVDIPLLYHDNDTFDIQEHGANLFVLNKKRLEEAANIVKDEKLGEVSWETWNCLSFYCDSVSWDGKEENMQCTGNGTKDDPFLNINYALKVLYCIVSRYCFFTPVILHVSGIVDYPVEHSESFRGCLIIDGGVFESKLNYQHNSLDIAGVHLFNVEYIESSHSMNTECDGIFEHRENQYIPVTLWRCSLKSNTTKFQGGWKIGNLIESEVDAIYARIQGCSVYRSTCNAFYFHGRSVYIGQNHFVLPCVVIHSEMILGSEVKPKERIALFDGYFVIDSILDCKGGASWVYANRLELKAHFETHKYYAPWPNADIKGQHTFDSSLNISGTSDYHECILSLGDARGCNIHIEDVLVDFYIYNMSSCSTDVKALVFYVDQWMRSGISFELEKPTDYLFDYFKWENNTFKVYLETDDQISVALVGNAHNNTFDITGSNSHSTHHPVTLRYYKENTQVSKYFNNNKTTVTLNGAAPDFFGAYANSNEIYYGLSVTPVGRYNYNFTAIFTKPVEYKSCYAIIEMYGTSPLCNSGASFQYSIGKEPECSRYSTIITELPKYAGQPFFSNCHTGRDLHVEKIKGVTCSGETRIAVVVEDEDIYNGNTIVKRSYSAYPEYDDDGCWTGGMISEGTTTTTETCK